MEHIENIILSKAKEEADSIISGALSGASEIIQKAKEKTQHIFESYKNRAKNYIELEKQRIFGKVQLEINSKMINTENEIVDRIFEGIENEILELFKDSKNYENYLRNIINETLNNNRFEKPTILVNPKDYEVVKDIVKDKEVRTDESVSYGIKVIDEGRGFVVTNTLETRIERVRQIILEKVREFWK
ncbi:MAG: V-type ATP synthase subunit E [candidate division WOR-3 bacterium]|nr:V-type ATP synthase subunit E [candidate division WOR-3 bacterium]MCX7946979.1 V-type ATP synthase subunit E [candidate division WOR-3 bacterium]MDW8149980.1 V-type ATP synthase subunit E [candidate division WOR-3 bacterium]